MGLFTFFANQAQPEDQAGSCDTTSKIHYSNESKDQMLNNAAVHSEHTGNKPDIRGDDDYDYQSSSTLSNDARFNTTILEADDRDGHYSPAKHNPGR